VLQSRDKGSQVAVIDADDLCAGSDYPGQVFLIVQFHKGFHAQCGRFAKQGDEVLIIEDFSNQQHGIGARYARLK
jgi:hypothetical protein